jgi:hypothetical protein
VGRAGCDSIYFMYLFKLIYLTLANLAKQAWALPQTVAVALQQKRRLATRREFETERLDRIRHPSKYLGK